MSARRIVALLCITAALVVSNAFAAKPDAARVDLRFMKPLDLQGKPVKLVENESRRGTAFVFISSDCPLSRQYIPELNRLAASEPTESVAFLGILSDRTVSRAAAKQFADEFDIQFPVVFDAAGELAELFGPTHVPQAFLVDSAGRIVYQGRIDDLYADVDKRRQEPTKHDLFDAMTALAKGEELEPVATETIGCLFEDRGSAADGGDVTFTRDIAPIVFANCSECHRPGEVAPFSLLTYEDVAKRAKWITEVTGSGLMPPWRAEIGHGHFLDERRLTVKEVQLIEQWAAAGAPKGDEDDMPPTPAFPAGWRLGTPDVVVEAPDFVTVPADGPDIFQHWVLAVDVPEDKVLIGYEFRPGNPAVVHHAIIALDNTGGSRRRDEQTPEPGYRSSGSIEGNLSAFVGVWTPGMTPRFYPDNVGIRVTPKTDVLLQLHLHPSGKEESDKSTVALYFADKPPEDMKTQDVFVTGTLVIDIPPGENNHEVSTSFTLPIDMTLSSVFPHMHLIGKDVNVEATLPDGEKRSLIFIKDWNFYWQDIYVYKDPMFLPAGTQIDLVAHFNNSAENPFNPSTPPKQVLFGNDSDDEMCFIIFQAIDEGSVRHEGSIRHRLGSSMMASFIREWREANLSPEAREHIIDEAVKLFGNGDGDSEMFKQLLIRNSTSKRKKKEKTPPEAAGAG